MSNQTIVDQLLSSGKYHNEKNIVQVAANFIDDLSKNNLTESQIASQLNKLFYLKDMPAEEKERRFKFGKAMMIALTDICASYKLQISQEGLSELGRRATKVMFCLESHNFRQIVLMSGQFIPDMARVEDVECKTFLGLFFRLFCFHPLHNPTIIESLGNKEVEQKEVISMIIKHSQLFSKAANEIFKKFFIMKSLAPTITWLQKMVEYIVQKTQITPGERDLMHGLMGHAMLQILINLYSNAVATLKLQIGIPNNPFHNLVSFKVLTSEWPNVPRCGPKGTEYDLTIFSEENKELKTAISRIILMVSKLYSNVVFWLFGDIKYSSGKEEETMSKIIEALTMNDALLTKMSVFFGSICDIAYGTIGMGSKVIAATPKRVLGSAFLFFEMLAEKNPTVIMEHKWKNLFILFSRFINASDVISDIGARVLPVDIICKYLNKTSNIAIMDDPRLAADFLNNLLKLMVEQQNKKFTMIELSSCRSQWLTGKLWNREAYRNCTAEIIAERKQTIKTLIPSLIADHQYCSEYLFNVICELRVAEEKDNVTEKMTQTAKTFAGVQYEKFRFWLELVKNDAALFDAFYAPFVKMLHYNINMMLGPACPRLCVTTKGIGFSPKELVSMIINIVTRFTGITVDKEKWISAFTGEDSGFNTANMAHMLTISQKYYMEAVAIPHAAVHGTMPFKDFVDIAIRVHDFVSIRVKEMGEANPEYLDAITHSVMRNPRRLPASDMIVDLDTIKRHLEKSPTDPFTRTPLTESDLVSCNAMYAHLNVFWSQIRLSVRSIIFNSNKK